MRVSVSLSLGCLASVGKEKRERVGERGKRGRKSVDTGSPKEKKQLQVRGNRQNLEPFFSQKPCTKRNTQGFSGTAKFCVLCISEKLHLQSPVDMLGEGPC